MAVFGCYHTHPDMKNYLLDVLKDSAKELNMSVVEFHDEVLDDVLTYWNEMVQYERENPTGDAHNNQLVTTRKARRSVSILASY